ncbi:hypothetical protein MHU86_854 [Fragilaria crotonensis]|nr:hypothetical protein MHU86_854 [Fragilaria crotonensis]
MKHDTRNSETVMTEKPHHDEPNQVHRSVLYRWIDPPLKPSDVIRRLEESLPSITIVNPMVDDSKSYFHINALPIGDTRPFEVVQKHITMLNGRVAGLQYKKLGLICCSVWKTNDENGRPPFILDH